MQGLRITLFTGLLAASAYAHADVSVPVHAVSADGVGPQIGSVSLADSKYGLVVTPDLKNLPAGVHGFHVHEKGSCDVTQQDGKPVPAGAAGGHYDPDGTKKHSTPWDDGGHRGDLPALYVSSDGTATTPVLAPRLKASEVAGRAIMVHAGGDNHSDHPKALGGGGGRIACGVIPQ
ncbi:superoxide dismutase family protein [Bordetella sp. 02P26C-1]|uniref:superoxide dismutase family protein n=1 Tax=Bordetella sp. 02P26C-1 TaxID=2683195 RepID=UPI001354FB0B|nr:superoxide dismutase family protein [Bordetella sp. 02P26C-1]MVW79497.1 superoxide dismutase [Cu-Zn] SodC2 [Bordetella sp. 02P26C-1]